MWDIPSLVHRPAQEEDINCVPLSEVTVSGTPNLEIQADTNASMQDDASWFFMGTASIHLVDRSIAVKR
jgi:hypothetical protein